MRLWHKDPNEENIIVCFLAKREGADVVGFPDRVQGCQRCQERRKNWFLAQLNLRQLKIRQKLDEHQQAIREKQEKEEQEIRGKRELLEAQMEAERAAVSLQVYEEIDESQKHSFLGYLEPAISTSKLSPNDQLAIFLENATMVTSALSNETPAFSKGAGQKELIIPVSVEPTTSLPASTVTLSNSLAQNMPTMYGSHSIRLPISCQVRILCPLLILYCLKTNPSRHLLGNVQNLGPLRGRCLDPRATALGCDSGNNESTV